MQIEKTGNRARPTSRGKNETGSINLSDNTVLGKSDQATMKYRYKKQGKTQQELSAQYDVSIEVVQEITRSKQNRYA